MRSTRCSGSTQTRSARWPPAGAGGSLAGGGLRARRDGGPCASRRTAVDGTGSVRTCPLSHETRQRLRTVQGSTLDTLAGVDAHVLAARVGTGSTSSRSLVGGPALKCSRQSGAGRPWSVEAAPRGGTLGAGGRGANWEDFDRLVRIADGTDAQVAAEPKRRFRKHDACRSVSAARKRRGHERTDTRQARDSTDRSATVTPVTVADLKSLRPRLPALTRSCPLVARSVD